MIRGLPHLRSESRMELPPDSVRPSVCLSVCLSVRRSADRPSVRPSVRLSVSGVRPPRPSVRPCMRPPVRLSTASVRCVRRIRLKRPFAAFEVSISHLAAS